MIEVSCAVMVGLMMWFLANIQNHYSGQVAELVGLGMISGFGLACIVGLCILAHERRQLPPDALLVNTSEPK